MHSADYAVARFVSVRLFIRLSHAGILVKLLDVNSHFFSMGSHYTFSVLNGVAISTRTPLTGALNAKKHEKITILDQYLALSRKSYKIVS